MKIGDTVKIYYYHYCERRLYGNGAYLGTERVLEKRHHGLINRELKKFAVKDGIIYESDCEWEEIE